MENKLTFEADGEGYQQVMVELEVSLTEKIQQAAKAKMMTVSDYIRFLVFAHFKPLDDGTAEIKQLISGPTRNSVVFVTDDGFPKQGWRKAAHNSFRVFDGSGTLVVSQGRYFILTAHHTAFSSPLPSYHPLVPVSREGKSYITKVRNKGRYQTFDYEMLEFVNREEEEHLGQMLGGISLLTEPITKGAFCFQLGYPNSWPNNLKHQNRIAGFHHLADSVMDYLPAGTPLDLVLSAGYVTSVEAISELPSFSIDARSGHGNSGGGVFVLNHSEAPLLAGIFTNTLGNQEVQGNAPHTPPTEGMAGQCVPTWLANLVH